VMVIAWEPCEIGLTQAVSKFAPETLKFALSTEKVTLGTGAPFEVAVSVSTTVPATTLSGTGLTPLLTVIVIIARGGGGGGA
jgi:hypothetical protein